VSLLTPFKDEEDAMQWYYNLHSIGQQQHPEGILDYFPMPPEQMPPEQMPQQQMPVETPTEPMPKENVLDGIDYSRPVKAWGPPTGGVPGSIRISQHMADWILNKYPEQEMSDRYEISGWDGSPETGWTPVYDNPILSYNKEIYQEYLNSPEYREYYNIAEQFGETESTADSESTPPLASLPIIPILPPESEIPPNNDGLMGIVGGGIIDPGPIYTAEEYEAYLDSLPPTTESAPLSIAYDSYSGEPYTY